MLKRKLKKIISICLSMVLAFSVTLPAYAEPDDKETTLPLAPTLPGDETVYNSLERWRQEYGEPPLFNNQIPNFTDDNKNTDNASLEKESTDEKEGHLVIGKDIENKKITNIVSIPEDKIKSVTIKNGVTSIGKSAFEGCTGLTSLDIPNSVTSIGEWAFYGCTDLTHIIIPDSVKKIAYHAFQGCKKLTSVTIGNGVKEIREEAFYDCTGLTSLDIPNSVTSIGKRAFKDCTGLTSINIPNSVTKICTEVNIKWRANGGAFSSCTGLTSINVDGGNKYYKSIDGVLFSKDGTTLHRYPAGKKSANYIIPNSVTKIGGEAFCNCTELTDITIPDSVKSIGREAFYDCTGLTSITIPDSVTKIGNYAFEGCTGLTSITVPDSVKSIGDFAFYDCTSLKEVTVPKGAKIGSYAFNTNTTVYKK